MSSAALPSTTTPLSAPCGDCGVGFARINGVAVRTHRPGCSALDRPGAGTVVAVATWSNEPLLTIHQAVAHYRVLPQLVPALVKLLAGQSVGRAVRWMPSALYTVATMRRALTQLGVIV